MNGSFLPNDVAFESIKSAPIKRQSIDGLVERWNSQMGGAQGHQLSKTWNLMYDKYLLGENAKGNPNLNVKEVPLIDLARQSIHLLFAQPKSHTSSKQQTYCHHELQKQCLYCQHQLLITFIAS
jgi:hypothetical protein